MPAAAVPCTWENPCAPCAAVNAAHGITDPSVVHNPWLMVPARDLVQGDTLRLRDLNGDAHVLGMVTAASPGSVRVHWDDDGEDVTYPTTGRRAGSLVRALRAGEKTFREEQAARRNVLPGVDSAGATP